MNAIRIAYQKPTKEDRNKIWLQKQIPETVKPYKEQTVKKKKTFLIICEGKNTEVEYFRSFPVPSKDIVVLGGHGSKSSLVKFALREMQKPEYEGREVWCVYDFDVKPDEGRTQPADFNRSINTAQENGLKVAWSNDAFELWFLLHYQNLEASLSRNEIFPIMKEYWELSSFSKEAKVKSFCEGHYDRHLEGNKGASQKLAIRRAKKLHQAYDSQKKYAEQCPCTTVYQLVEELNNNLK